MEAHFKELKETFLRNFGKNVFIDVLEVIYFFFGKLNKTDVKIGTNKGAFTLNIEKNMYSVLSTNTQKASKKKKKLTRKKIGW